MCARAHPQDVGFIAAVGYLDSVAWEAIQAHERALGERFLSGDFYAVEIVRRLGLAPGGIVHYTTADEVDRLLESLAAIA